MTNRITPENIEQYREFVEPQINKNIDIMHDAAVDLTNEEINTYINDKAVLLFFIYRGDIKKVNIVYENVLLGQILIEGLRYYFTFTQFFYYKQYIQYNYPAITVPDDIKSKILEYLNKLGQRGSESRGKTTIPPLYFFIEWSNIAVQKLTEGFLIQCVDFFIYKVVSSILDYKIQFGL
jgi:hypothetical protein